MLCCLQSCKQKNSLQVARQEKIIQKQHNKATSKHQNPTAKPQSNQTKNHNKHIPLAMMFWFMYMVIVYLAKQRFFREWFSHGRTALSSPGAQHIALLGLVVLCIGHTAPAAGRARRAAGILYTKCEV